ncbi:MAG: zinc-binding dehydrogenase [Cyclobacteriaceae bacterium]|nr:zinc-binding dehydrogenase [Cyclobacteriaceae bacterium]
MQRHAWRMMPKAGSIDHLKLVEESIENPEAYEVQIEVKAIGLNFADIFAMYGLYGATPPGSFVPGLEFSGIVLQKGGKVSSLSIGDKVMGVTRFGGYTSHLNINQSYLVPLPEDWNFEEGAAYLVQVLTAYYGLVELGNLKPEQTVLIQSAAGGVGLWANRIAKLKGAFTIGCVGSESKLPLLRTEGYDVGFVRGKNFRNELHKALGKRALHLVMECVGGRVFMDSYLAMAPEGRMIVYGSARYAQTSAKPNYLKLLWLFWKRPKLDPQKMIEQNKAVMGFNLIYLYENAPLLHKILGELSQMDLGKPHVGHSFGFNAMKEAISLFQTGKTTGKVVVKLD